MLISECTWPTLFCDVGHNNGQEYHLECIALPAYLLLGCSHTLQTDGPSVLMSQIAVGLASPWPKKSSEGFQAQDLLFRCRIEWSLGGMGLVGLL